MYVVDPFEARVHRVVELSSDLRAAAAVLVGPEAVYLQAWRDGFSGGLGKVSLACVEDRGECEADLFVEFGNVGGTPFNSLYYREGSLYPLRGPNSEDEIARIDRINPRTGSIEASDDLVIGASALRNGSVYVQSYISPEDNLLIKVDSNPLAEQMRVPLDSGFEQAQELVALDGDRLYLAGRSPLVQVRSAETLEIGDIIDISAASERPSNNFGFVAPGLLMLNEQDFVDVRTGEVLADVFPLEEQIALSLRFPEGHPLAN